ncbi:MAG: hypothetical protein HYZ09_03750 [Candidatus Kerfeldbacteria bacterium]|nr:hypothetical protein [Candidatus Kerfeldbacteria bacterium]
MARPTPTRTTRRGFSLLETVVTIGVLIIIGEVVFSWSFLIRRSASEAQARTVASGIATEWVELIRNAPYEDIGTTAGYPTGTFPSSQTVTRGGIAFQVNIAIDYVDDPYDGDALGTIPLKPVDTVPADYKRVEVEVCWRAACANPLQLTTTVAPPGVESSSGTGALFLTILDSAGQAVPLVNIHVTNASLVPPLDITNQTDVFGKLQLLSLPPATGTYHVEVGKTGYTNDQTFTPDAGNPNPVTPDTTVVASGVTELTLYVDQVSSVAVQTLRADTCAPESSVQFQLTGLELIGLTPDVLRYDQTHTTGIDGSVNLTGMRWDTYLADLLTATFDLAGVDPPSPWVLGPNVNLATRLFLADHEDSTLLVTVLDAGTDLPLTDASVRVEGTGYDETLVTNQGFLAQTDWSGGSGQTDFVDPTRYFSNTGALDASAPGQVSLASQLLNDVASEDFSSTTYRDDSTTSAVWTVGSPGSVTIPFDPVNPGQYLGAAAAQSTKLNPQEGRILDVTLTAVETLNGEIIEYFVAADGVQFEPVTPNVPHVFTATGSDLRWRAVLSTNTPTVTPELRGATLSFHQRVFTGTDATLISSTFDTKAASTFSTLTWNPTTQPADAGPDALRIQIATNNDNATWNFVGPDGTVATHYTVSGASLAAAHAGDRYLRYQVLLHSDSPLVGPVLSDLSIVHSNSCQPPGQVFFSPLPADGDYTVTVDRTGYVQAVQPVTVAGNDRVIIPLNPVP